MTEYAGAHHERHPVVAVLSDFCSWVLLCFKDAAAQASEFWASARSRTSVTLTVAVAAVVSVLSVLATSALQSKPAPAPTPAYVIAADMKSAIDKSAAGASYEVWVLRSDMNRVISDQAKTIEQLKERLAKLEWSPIVSKPGKKAKK